jgi:hypothetical protein
MFTRTATPDAVQEPLAEEDCAPRPGSDLQGFWKGTLTEGKTALRLHLKIAEASNRTFRAELNFIDQPPIHPIPVRTLEYNRPDVKISLQTISGTFQGQLDASGSTISGKWPWGSATFTRADQKVEQQALEAGKNYEYASNTDLQGHWAGTLPGDYGLHLHLIFNIAQLSDGSFAATLDSPDQLLFAMPFDSVTFAPPKVRMEIKSAGCVYEGTFSNGKLSGRWNSKISSSPLVLQRIKPGQSTG